LSLFDDFGNLADKMRFGLMFLWIRIAKIGKYIAIAAIYGACQ